MMIQTIFLNKKDGLIFN